MNNTLIERLVDRSGISQKEINLQIGYYNLLRLKEINTGLIRAKSIYKEDSFTAINLTIKLYKELLKDFTSHSGFLVSPPLYRQYININPLKAAWI